MQAKSEIQKEEFISSKYLRCYKVFSASLIALILGTVVFMLYLQSGDWLSRIPQILVTSSFLILCLSVVFRLRSVSYDGDQLYIHSKGRDLIIPFSDVKYIRLANFLGVHEVSIKNHPELGEKFRFKPSILYPLNFWKVDHRIDELKNLIANYKKNLREETVYQKLSSQHFGAKDMNGDQL